MQTLVLASQSPRRKDLLQKAGFAFEIHSVKISEFLDKNLSLDEGLMEIARQKASALIDSGKLLKSEDYIVLSADTVVVLGEDVLGKPKSIEDAHSHLRRLSGRTHVVKTAVCLWNGESKVMKTALENSQVKFRKIAEEEIIEYVACGEPMDKAGAYAVQGVGGKFIEKITGPVDNVIGLPVELFEEMLKKNGWNVDRTKNSDNS